MKKYICVLFFTAMPFSFFSCSNSENGASREQLEDRYNQLKTDYDNL
jgi:hypothetical protein